MSFVSVIFPDPSSWPPFPLGPAFSHASPLIEAADLRFLPLYRLLLTKEAHVVPCAVSCVECKREDYDILSIVLLLPPAPAARVLLGLALATLSALSAAAFLLMAVAGPPGAFGDDGRAVVDPVEGAALTGEEARGED